MSAHQILIQEPSLDIQELYCAILRECGVRPVFVQNAEEVPTALSHAAYALVIVDQCGPDATGLTLTEWVNGVAPRLPVILVSTVKLDDSMRIRLERSGHNTFLRKPFDIRLLREAVESAVEVGAAASAYAHNPDLMRVAI